MAEPIVAKPTIKGDPDPRHWRWGQIHFVLSLLVILSAYYIGLSWFLNLLDQAVAAHSLAEKNQNIITILFLKQLFCLGLLGGAMHCHIFIAKEFNQYHRNKSITHAPMAIDFLGYIMQIVGGGLTGVILFFALKTGLVIVTSGSLENIKDMPITLTPYAEWLIAFAGGLGTHHVKAFLDKFGQSSTGAKGKYGNEQAGQDPSAPKDTPENLGKSAK
jgi:hypothetical protein